MSYAKQTWVKGEKVTSTKLNHMEEGIASGGSGAQSDYNQNNSHAEDYIKNRPFYGETNSQWLTFVDGEYTFEQWAAERCSVSIAFDNFITIIPQGLMKVMLDGVEYDNLEIKFYSGGISRATSYTAYIGATEGEYGPDFNEYPFNISLSRGITDTSVQFSTNEFYVTLADSSIHHTLKIQQYVTNTDVVVTQLFRDAVDAVTSSPLEVSFTFNVGQNAVHLESHSVQDIMDYCSTHNSIMWTEVNGYEPPQILYLTERFIYNGATLNVVLGNVGVNNTAGLSLGFQNTFSGTRFNANGSISQYTYSVYDL